ncbi:MAG: hypothetical protein JWR26_2430 [Pedosphaera sp.]|nr:hypothetical protein [Pedosphaera sp.]
MSEGKYLKCSCKLCGNHIEFPQEAVGATVNCPHCGQPTVLSAGDRSGKPALGSGVGLIAVVGILIIVGAGVGVWFWLHGRQQAGVAMAQAVKVADAPLPRSKQTNDPVVAQAVEKPKKSADDLKVGAVALEKTKGSSLVYAVGKVKNDSDFQRFGVRIELDLMDKTGAKIGTAKDYIGILEPRHDWEFRALIPVSKAAEAKVASIREEE